VEVSSFCLLEALKDQHNLAPALSTPQVVVDDNAVEAVVAAEENLSYRVDDAVCCHKFHDGVGVDQGDHNLIAREH